MIWLGTRVTRSWLRFVKSQRPSTRLGCRFRLRRLVKSRWPSARLGLPFRMLRPRPLRSSSHCHSSSRRSSSAAEPPAARRPPRRSWRARSRSPPGSSPARPSERTSRGWPGSRATAWIRRWPARHSSCARSRARPASPATSPRGPRRWPRRMSFLPAVDWRSRTAPPPATARHSPRRHQSPRSPQSREGRHAHGGVRSPQRSRRPRRRGLRRPTSGSSHCVLGKGASSRCRSQRQTTFG
mmetsp:Transcript_43448/g.125409  ORF Transcript_43448/g.125409 Transcript_43448/m.125409 type:complete len:240 (-) Transcript_43448:1818-2537(-)